MKSEKARRVRACAYWLRRSFLEVEVKSLAVGTISSDEVPTSRMSLSVLMISWEVPQCIADGIVSTSSRYQETSGALRP